MAYAIDPRLDESVIVKTVHSRLERFAGALTHIPRWNLELLSALRLRGMKLGLISNADAMEIPRLGRIFLGGLLRQHGLFL